MITGKSRAPYILSILIAVLSMVASAVGLFSPSLYQDNALVTAAWHGNDLITLIITVPMLLGSMYFTLRGSGKGLLLWIGALGYMLYNYIFYLYGTAFNGFFLIYVLLFTLSIYNLILFAVKTDALAISQAFSPRTPTRSVSVFMLFFGVLLGGLWIAMSLGFVFMGKVPAAITQTDHSTGIVFATDLSLLVSTLLVSAILLWQKKPWGYVLATAILVKASTYGLVMMSMSVFTSIELGIVDPMIPLWILLSLGCLISCFLMLVNLKQAALKEILKREG